MSVLKNGNKSTTNDDAKNTNEKDALFRSKANSNHGRKDRGHGVDGVAGATHSRLYGSVDYFVINNNDQVPRFIRGVVSRVGLTVRHEIHQILRFASLVSSA